MKQVVERSVESVESIAGRRGTWRDVESAVEEARATTVESVEDVEDVEGAVDEAGATTIALGPPVTVLLLLVALASTRSKLLPAWGENTGTDEKAGEAIAEAETKEEPTVASHSTRHWCCRPSFQQRPRRRHKEAAKAKNENAAPAEPEDYTKSNDQYPVDLPGIEPGT
ncbi:hypothetical protein LTS16_025036 [Friedmanniomyces endolithicus]|nr:hypothetical protein LTS16_025036 [Friedmanniomyces endolithicus]